MVLDFETEIDLLNFNPDYPKNPRTFGEALRKARMDRGMIIKELAALIGVTDTSIINWEIRGKMPTAEKMEKVKRFLTSEGRFHIDMKNGITYSKNT